MSVKLSLSPTDIHYFLAVAEHGNISHAAEHLAISQPSLSLAIKRIEQTIGCQVLGRHKRGVFLTPAGQQLQTNAQALLRQWEHLLNQALAANNTIQGKFSIGCNASIALYGLVNALPALLAAHPGLRLQLVNDRSRPVLDDINNFSLDLGITINPTAHPSLILRKLGADIVKLWSGEKAVSLAKLASQPFTLIADPQLAQSQAILKSLAEQQITPSRVIECADLQVASALASQGVGVIILPERVAKLTPALQSIKNSPVVHDEIYLCYRSENRHLKAMQAIVAAIKTGFK
jgi:DNA-binding transcriptional LysR family regulator